MGLVFLINFYYIFELCSVTFVGFDIYIYIYIVLGERNRNLSLWKKSSLANSLLV